MNPGHKPIHIYESTGNDSFALAHVIDLADSNQDSYTPADVGDLDGDLLSDLVIRESDHVGPALEMRAVQVYESASTTSFPSELAWEVLYDLNTPLTTPAVADPDADGKAEIVVRDAEFFEGRLTIYENEADDDYVESYSLIGIPDAISTVQSFAILNDVDDDGRGEIVIGGGGGAFNLVALESAGDNTYEHVWSWAFDPYINTTVLIDAGDLDGDRKKEFLAGGSGGGTWLHVLESTGDNSLEIVETFFMSSSQGGYTSANVADVDGDGRREIVFASGSVVRIYRNVGNDTWDRIWVGSGNSIQAVGAGDHDGDGKEEIIFRAGTVSEGVTRIWEIYAGDAADQDADDTVDAIDNCPAEWNPGQEDADADAVGDLCDNCKDAANPTQGPAVLGQEVVWPLPVTSSRGSSPWTSIGSAATWRSSANTRWPS